MIDRNFKKELKGRERRLKGNALHLQVLIEKIYSRERYMIKNPFRTDDDNDVFRMCGKETQDLYIEIDYLSKEIIENYYLSMRTVQMIQEKYGNEIELIQKGVQNRKINTIKQICTRVQNIYRVYLSCLIDIRSVVETINSIKNELKLSVDRTTEEELSNTIHKTFLQINCYQNSNVMIVLNQVATASSFSEVWDLYKLNKDVLSEFTIIKRSVAHDPAWVATDLFEVLPSSKKEKYPIYSFFGENKVNYVSNRILISPTNTCINERNITFDTNVISYFKNQAKGKKLNIDFSPIIEFLTNQERVQFDYMPFVVENYLSGNYTAANLTEEINTIERYLSINFNQKYRDKHANQLVSELQTPELIFELKSIYNSIYARLMAIVWIRLKYIKSPVDKQFENLCEIFGNELHDYAIPELSMAYDFYNSSERTAKFFKKIQLNAPDLIDKIKNMSWDLFHIRSSMRQCLVKQEGSDLLVPYIATYDDGLSKILEYYQLDALAVCTRTKEMFPYYITNKVPEKLRIKYFNDTFKQHNVNLAVFINKYEKLIQEL